MGEVFVNTLRIYEISLKKVQVGSGTRISGTHFIFFSCVRVCFSLAYLTVSHLGMVKIFSTCNM